MASCPRNPAAIQLLVLALGVVLRVLGFGYLIVGKRGPLLLVSLLLATTLLAWSPWLAVTALGAALAIAGAFRLPCWQVLAVGMQPRLAVPFLLDPEVRGPGVRHRAEHGVSHAVQVAPAGLVYGLDESRRSWG